MDTKVFLDTNIILDILDDKRPFHSPAVELYRLLKTGEPDAYISESILTTTDYILQKSVGKSIRISLLSQLLDFLQVLPCTTKTCQKAIRSNFTDLEDAILYQIALENDVDFFITNDNKALKKLSLPALPVISSKEFLNINR
jgi:predicted nucleic acid-binding protein